MNLDDDIRKVYGHLKIVLKVAGGRYNEHNLFHVAKRGWLERQKEEEQQSEFACVCWSAELFAAAETVMHKSPGEFDGVAAFLCICAVDALDPMKPSGPVTKSTLTKSLERQGVQTQQASELAAQLWNLRCTGVHRALTDRIDVKAMVMVGGNLVSGDTLEEVMAEHRKQGSKGTVTLIEQSAFSRNMYLFHSARHTSAEAITHRIIELTKEVANQ